jgi:hypothetical protein
VTQRQNAFPDPDDDDLALRQLFLHADEAGPQPDTDAFVSAVMADVEQDKARRSALTRAGVRWTAIASAIGAAVLAPYTAEAFRPVVLAWVALARPDAVMPVADSPVSMLILGSLAAAMLAFLTRRA